MRIVNYSNRPFNFSNDLIPLFNAMKRGQVVKKVTCFLGEVNRNNPEKDFTVENFKATTYTVGLVGNANTGQLFDYVENDKKDAFYMSWVKSYEL